MKLIKKIAAIMFAFMMVFSLSTNAKAEEGTGSTGSITVSNAVNGQDYTLYKILDLVSYVPGTASTDPDDNGIYSYKPNVNWTEFLDDNTEKGGKPYIKINKDGYADWDGKKTDARRAEFAKKALAWANENHIDFVGKTTASGGKAEFTDLTLGYYLVDSSVGALCTLTTTNPNIQVKEKNDTPVLEKRVNIFKEAFPNYAPENKLVKNTTANFGEQVIFTLTIKNLKGAEKLSITDTMDEGLTLPQNSFMTIDLVSQDSATNGTDGTGIVEIKSTEYTLKKSRKENKDLFTIEFKPEAYKKIEQNSNYVLRISYAATVNNNAVLNNTNTATLKYGDGNETTDKAYVGTLNIPVFKYTLKGEQEEALPGAEFTLYKDADCKNAITFSKDDVKNTYNYDENATNTTLTSDNAGNISINGLKEDTYYLKETKAPEGYNLLKDKIQVTIKPVVDDNKVITEQKITVLENGAENKYDKVKVLNNHGTILPSTGGMGTTLIYLIGGALVLGSGFVLANKKRAKAK